jgi:hypothetical protein
VPPVLAPALSASKVTINVTVSGSVNVSNSLSNVNVTVTINVPNCHRHCQSNVNVNVTATINVMNVTVNVTVIANVNVTLPSMFDVRVPAPSVISLLSNVSLDGREGLAYRHYLSRFAASVSVVGKQLHVAADHLSLASNSTLFSFFYVRPRISELLLSCRATIKPKCS